MADDKKRHLPYEEDAQIFTNVLMFFVEKLPHAMGVAFHDLKEMAEELDEAELSSELFNRMSSMTEEQLEALGLHREDIAKVSAHSAGLLRVAHKHVRNKPA